VLEDLKVSDAMMDRGKPETFSADTPFRKILERIKGSSASVFPIVDESGCLLGVFSLSDIRQIMNERDVGNLVLAGDLGTTDVTTVTPETNLDVALRIFTQKNLEELPVVEEHHTPGARISMPISVRRPRGPTGTKRVLGMLSRRDLIAAYHRRLHAVEVADAQENRGSHVFIDALDAVPEISTETAPAEQTSFPADASRPGPELLDDPPESGR